MINLGREPHRLDWFFSQPTIDGLVFERFPAIDGRTLPAPEVERLTALNTGEHPMGPLEVACFLSHRELWRRIAAGDEPWVFVAKDDFYFSPDCAYFLSSDAWMPPSADIIKAETFIGFVDVATFGAREVNGHSVQRLLSSHLGSGGYFLSKDGAAKLLDLTQRACEPADCAMFSPVIGALKALRVFQMDPAIGIQDFKIGEYKYMARHGPDTQHVMRLMAQDRISPLVATANGADFKDFYSDLSVERVETKAVVRKPTRLAKLKRELTRPILQARRRFPAIGGMERKVIRIDLRAGRPRAGGPGAEHGSAESDRRPRFA